MQVRQVWLSSAAARRKQLSLTPPITRGVLQLHVLAHARVDALGGERHEHVLADPQPALGRAAPPAARGWRRRSWSR